MSDDIFKPVAVVYDANDPPRRDIVMRLEPQRHEITIPAHVAYSGGDRREQLAAVIGLLRSSASRAAFLLFKAGAEAVAKQPIADDEVAQALDDDFARVVRRNGEMSRRIEELEATLAAKAVEIGVLERVIANGRRPAPQPEVRSAFLQLGDKPPYNLVAARFRYVDGALQVKIGDQWATMPEGKPNTHEHLPVKYAWGQRVAGVSLDYK